jgi:hypothetical protein
MSDHFPGRSLNLKIIYLDVEFMINKIGQCTPIVEPNICDKRHLTVVEGSERFIVNFHYILVHRVCVVLRLILWGCHNIV